MKIYLKKIKIPVNDCRHKDIICYFKKAKKPCSRFVECDDYIIYTQILPEIKSIKNLPKPRGK